MKKFCSAVLGIAAVIAWSGFASATVTLETGWPVNVKGPVLSGINLVDLDSDGDAEICVVADKVGHVFQHDGTELAPWPMDDTVQGLVSQCSSTPALADIAGDATLEFIFGQRNKKIYALLMSDGDSDGFPDDVTGWPYTFSTVVTGRVSSPVAAADVDGDGKDELFVGVQEGDNKTLLALDGDGTLLPGWTTLADVAAIDSGPALADIDHDWAYEIVYGDDSGTLRAFEADGTPVAGWTNVVAGGPIKASPSVGDIDGDTRVEIVFGANDSKIYAVEVDGTAVTGWPITIGGGVAEIKSDPALADFDGDGDVEVAVGTVGTNKQFYLLDGDGSIMTGWPVNLNGDCDSSPVVADVDGDGEFEVVFVARALHSLLYALNADGTPAETWPASINDFPDVDINSYSTPALGNVDDDSNLEVAVGNNRLGGEMMVFEVSADWNPDLAPWPTHRADIRNTGDFPAFPVIDTINPPQWTEPLAPCVVEVTGLYFYEGARVKLVRVEPPGTPAEIEATQVVVNSPSSITATFNFSVISNPGTPVVWDFVVENPPGRAGTVSRGFRFGPPTPSLSTWGIILAAVAGGLVLRSRQRRT